MTNPPLRLYPRLSSPTHAGTNTDTDTDTDTATGTATGTDTGTGTVTGTDTGPHRANPADRQGGPEARAPRGTDTDTVTVTAPDAAGWFSLRASWAPGGRATMTVT